MRCLLRRSHLVCLWPAIVVLHITGLEAFTLPTLLTATATGSYTLNVQLQGLATTVCLALIVNLLSTHAMNLTTPVFSGAGMALTIPASVLADTVLHGHGGDGAVSSGTQWAGMLSIIAGFFGLVLAR